MSDNPRRKKGFGCWCKTRYVAILLKLLPFLVNTARHLSSSIEPELDYLGSGYTFQLKVEHSKLQCVCRVNKKGKLRGVPRKDQATDVAAGSGLPSADPHAVTIDYVIAFRSIDYAFSCFSGGASLKEALAERAFSTRGPNNTGVALTYMFTALLRLFFFWRRPYKKTPAQATTR